MAKGLKEIGVRELDSVLSRTRRQLSMGRISEQDFNTLSKMLKDAQVFILNMTEIDDNLQPEGLF